MGRRRVRAQQLGSSQPEPTQQLCIHPHPPGASPEREELRTPETWNRGRKDPESGSQRSLDFQELRGLAP